MIFFFSLAVSVAYGIKEVDDYGSESYCQAMRVLLQLELYNNERRLS